MASTSKSRLVYLDKLLDLNTIEHFDCWPLKGLRPRASENITALYDHLKSLSVNQPWNVYLRDVDMPPRWHFSATYRIAPLFLVPDPGWVILNSKAEFDPEEDEDYYPKGIHGYDNDDELMRSIFLGRGPSLRYDYPVKSFENVEVYGIMTNILGITGIPNNGTFIKGRMQRLSAPPKPTAPSSPASATSTPSTDDDGIPEMTPEDWKEIEEDLAEAEEEEGRPLTWKEYLELKAEEMKEEVEVWWDWLTHGGGHGR
jgi:Type I phosphodiesterase / nucleotide pyrophosphatase